MAGVIVGLVIAPLVDRDAVPVEGVRTVLGFGLFTLLTIVLFRHLLGMRPRPRARGQRRG